MSFSVVICAHTSERLELLRQAISSVLDQDYPDFELIVIIDHNPGLLLTISGEFPDAKVFPNAGSRGLSDARNTGVSHASKPFVAFLDDDATADPDWLSRLSLHYADPHVLAVGGRIVPVWPDSRPSWFPPEFDWSIGCSYTGLPQSTASVRNLIGCNMSVRRECIDAVGGFRTDLGRVGDNAAGCEETELFIRLKEKFEDGIILLDPKATVSHSIAESRTRWRYFAARCKAEGRAKAMLAGNLGSRQSLASEASYARKVLPAGVLKGFKDAWRGDLHGLLRSGAIAGGFFMTSGSYVKERLRLARRGAAAPAPFEPLLIVDADLSKGLPVLPRVDPVTGQRYGAAWCLVRSSGQPVKILEVPFDRAFIPPAEVAALVNADPLSRQPPPLPAAVGPNAPHVTVVIATRDRAESLRLCLDSLMGQTYHDMDIVVVDNAPTTSATRDLVLNTFARSGRVSYVLEKVPGLGRAHNTGFAVATGEVIAFTDDDVIVDPSWVSAIAANFAHSERIGCVTGLILPAELQTKAQYWTERHGGFGKGLSRKVFDPELENRENPLFPYAAGAFGSGANMAFRRETLVRMGGFDPALGAGTLARGGDDLAGFVAALQAGYELVYEPGAIVWHHHRQSLDGMRRQAYGYGVGLGAYLTKLVVDDPRRLGVFARKTPAAIRHLFSPRSDKLARLPDDYPSRLIWSERLGILMGVPGYIRSRNRVRRDRAKPTSAAPATVLDI